MGLGLVGAGTFRSGSSCIPGGSCNNKRCNDLCSIFWSTFGLFFLILLLSGVVIGIVFGEAVGELKYLCGAYGNEMIEAECSVIGCGYLPIYGRTFDESSKEWVRGVVDEKYMLVFEVVTKNTLEYDNNITIYFKSGEDFDAAVTDHSLGVDCGVSSRLGGGGERSESGGVPMDCKVLNWLLRPYTKDSKNPNENKFIKGNGEVIFTGWDDNKLTFRADMFCGYSHVIYGSVLAYALFLTFGIAGITTLIAWCCMKCEAKESKRKSTTVTEMASIAPSRGRRRANKGERQGAMRTPALPPSHLIASEV